MPLWRGLTTTRSRHAAPLLSRDRVAGFALLPVEHDERRRVVRAHAHREAIDPLREVEESHPPLEILARGERRILVPRELDVPLDLLRRELREPVREHDHVGSGSGERDMEIHGALASPVEDQWNRFTLFPPGEIVLTEHQRFDVVAASAVRVDVTLEPRVQHPRSRNVELDRLAREAAEPKGPIEQRLVAGLGRTGRDPEQQHGQDDRPQGLGAIRQVDPPPFAIAPDMQPDVSRWTAGSDFIARPHPIGYRRSRGPFEHGGVPARTMLRFQVPAIAPK
jgi:hypothetical protein